MEGGAVEGEGESGAGTGVDLALGGSVRVVLVTGPDRETLLGIGKKVVEERLAACVNVFGGVRSVYRWQGSVQAEDESMAVLKSTEGRLDELARRVRELHPYDEPEFLAIPVSRGSSSYLEWVESGVEPSAGSL